MEEITIVDENDNITGSEEKMKVHEKGLLHRAFSIFIINSKGEMLLQKRAKCKYHSGGLWTNTCCGHPRKNEYLESAAKRRLLEETGLVCNLKKAFIFRYRVKFENGLIENEIVHVFIGYSDNKPLLNYEEAEDYKWISLEELSKDVLLSSNKYTYWFKIALGKYLQII